MGLLLNCARNMFRSVESILLARHDQRKIEREKCTTQLIRKAVALCWLLPRSVYLWCPDLVWRQGAYWRRSDVWCCARADPKDTPFETWKRCFTSHVIATRLGLLFSPSPALERLGTRKAVVTLSLIIRSFLQSCSMSSITTLGPNTRSYPADTARHLLVHFYLMITDCNVPSYASYNSKNQNLEGVKFRPQRRVLPARTGRT
jgi:hypothetical protein